MLNIPEEVKIALREGNLRKNYRFVYYTEGTGYSIIDRIAYNSTKTLESAGKYRVSIDTLDDSFSISVTTVSTSESTSYEGITTIYDTYVEFEITEKSTLRITSIQDHTLVIDVELFMYDSQITRTIDNNDLVLESVKIDERMATGKNLKFGLCEGSSVEFQYFNHSNINGKDIDAYLDVQYFDNDSTLSWYTIPMGRYTVDQCPIQWSTGIYKVLAYNKLKSGYLDRKMNSTLADLYSTNATVTMFDIQKQLCDGYEIIDDRYDLLNWSRNGSSYQDHQYIPIYSSFSLTQEYGINSPINPCNFSDLDIERPFYMGIFCQLCDYGLYYPSLLPEQYTFVSQNGSIVELEKRVVQYIKDIVDNAELNVTGDQVIDYICAHDGFQYVFGIRKNSSGTIKDYSTVQWEYEKNHNIAHTVAGTISDINGVNNHTASANYDTVAFNYPTYFYIRLTSDGNNKYFISFDGRSGWVSPSEYSYTYWKDSSKQETITDYLAPLYYPNGEKFIGNNSAGYKMLQLAKIKNLTDADNISSQISSLPEFTLREILSATYELNCQYGKLDRETDLFAGVELNQGGLYPADNLYPDNTLYPQGNMIHPLPCSYSKLWTDTVGEQSFRYLIITYKAIEGGQEVEKTLQRTVNTYGTTNYNMSDNWLFRNLVWTPEQVGDYADAMVDKMRDIRWFPFEMWAAGLPHIETGDAIEITDKNGDTYTSYVLTRTLNGIQNLQDTFINGELDVF